MKINLPDAQRKYSRLWKDVTYYLKAKQLNQATVGKSFLEQRQRQEAKERAEQGLKWQTKVNETIDRIPYMQHFLLVFCTIG